MIKDFKIPFFILLGLVFSPLSSTAKKYASCTQSLSESIEDTSHTQQFNAYMARLLLEGVLTPIDIENFVLSLTKQQKLTNPFGSLEDNKNIASHSRLSHAKNLQFYIENADLDFQEILSWSQNQLSTQQQTAEAKQATTETTSSPYVQMKFYPIKARTFDTTNQFGHKMKVTLTTDFEMMHTPVTQAMWIELMKDNPAEWQDGPHKLDHPIENITWWSAAVFANRLSDKMGYKKVYDFSKVKFRPGTSAEKGTLEYSSGKWKINGTNIYQTDGFRLPTWAELKLTTNHLVKKARVNESNVHRTGWFADNIDEEQTQDVMGLKKILIDGNPFFDLIGNVRQLSTDDYPEEELKGKDCVDPVCPPDNSIRLTFGGSFKTASKQAFAEDPESPNTRIEDTGFRLVRSLVKP